MNPNIDYCGVLTLLWQLVAAGTCTNTQAKQIARKVAKNIGVDAPFCFENFANSLDL